LPERASSDKLLDRQALREIVNKHPGDLPAYALLAMADEGVLAGEVVRLRSAMQRGQASGSDKVKYGIVLFLKWLETHPQPSRKQDFRGLWDALEWLEAGYKEVDSPFVGYMLAVAYSQDAPRANFGRGLNVLAGVIQKLMSPSLWKRIVGAKAPGKRPAPEEVVLSVRPSERRVVKYLLATYRQWLLARVWIETIEPGKPRIRKQVAPTKEQKRLANYLEQVIARL